MEPYGAQSFGQRWWVPVKAEDAVSDDKGRIRLLHADELLGVDLRIMADGYGETNLTLLKPVAEPYEIIVPRGTAVSGRVVQRGIPQAGVRIAVAQTDRSPEHFIRSVIAVTDREGRFEFHALPRVKSTPSFHRLVKWTIATVHRRQTK